MTCNEAMTSLTASVAAREAAGQAVSADVVEHLAGCPHCLEELAVLATLATGEASTFLDAVYGKNGCELVRRLMPELVTPGAEGEQPGSQHAAAWRHVQRCAACRAEYSVLEELTSAANAGEFGPVPGTRNWVLDQNDVMAVLAPRLADGPEAFAATLLNAQQATTFAKADGVVAEQDVTNSLERVLTIITPQLDEVPQPDQALGELKVAMASALEVMTNTHDLKDAGANDARFLASDDARALNTPSKGTVDRAITESSRAGSGEAGIGGQRE